MHLALNEALATETGVDAHDQHQVAELQAVLQAVQGGAGVEHGTGQLAEILDLTEVAVQMGAGFHLHRNDVGAGLGEFRHIFFRLHDHQVNVESLLGDRAQGLHNQGADGDIGHKAPIHHIDMDPVGAGFVHSPHILTEA